MYWINAVAADNPVVIHKATCNSARIGREIVKAGGADRLGGAGGINEASIGKGGRGGYGGAAEEEKEVAWRAY